MQAAAPEAVDLSQESAATRQLYGMDEEITRRYGTNCLLARRLVERGVRFVELYCGSGSKWDAHTHIEENHTRMCRISDKPVAGLLADLKSRGLLESTLVIWGGEFGRTPFNESGDGRDHNPWGFSMFMAGARRQEGRGHRPDRRDRPSRHRASDSRPRSARHDHASDGTRSYASYLPAQWPVRARDRNGRGIGQRGSGLRPEVNKETEVRSQKSEATPRQSEAGAQGLRALCLELEAQLQSSWIDNAAAWTDAVRQGRIPSRKAGTDGAILDAVRSFPPCSLLDLGCGEGWLARTLSAEGYTVTGVDASAPLIEKAAKAGGGVFVAMSYQDLVLEQQFNLVVANFSLLGENIRPILEKVHRWLAKDGAMIIQTLHPMSQDPDMRYQSGWRIETFAQMGDGFTAQMPYYFRTFSRWIEELNAAGLSVVRCHEPLHAESGRPVSLLIVAMPKH